VRVEYKAIFDGSVRDQLPKIVSSFANSQGGVLVIGVRAVNGTPQEPFEGFAVAPREEYPLTVENICLRNIHPPLFPRTEVVQSDVPGQVFLVIDVDESSESPHSIENSKKVYVRTGQAANPYDLADVDLIIDLVKRRREPLERRDRLIAIAVGRSEDRVDRLAPFLEIRICPSFPRTPLCSTQEAWEFLRNIPARVRELVSINSLRRIPDGAASVTLREPGQPGATQYLEVNRYGMLLLSRPFGTTTWHGNQDLRQQLRFADLFQALLRFTVLAQHFYTDYGFAGAFTIQVSLQRVRGQSMRFVGPPQDMPFDDPEDFRCHSTEVFAERLVTLDQIRDRKAEVLTEILTELTWAFWQHLRDLPVDVLRVNVQQLINQIGG
jgi:hypothetical protein